jgi:hypothetical protein
MVSTVATAGEPGRLRLMALLIFLLAATTAWADISLQPDRTRLIEGETVTLTFSSDDPGQRLDGDFSVLEKDFEILDRRTETQLSIVNGRQTAVVRLVMTVEPRRSGELTIPPIDFGDGSSEAVKLTVDPAPELPPGELPPVFLEVEISPEAGPYYVHAQFGLIVRVFYQQNLTEAAISQPEPSPASVRLLQETPYQAERGGKRYRVLERHYAIFPERSGELTVPAMELTGRLVERRSSGVWQPTVRGRRIRVESEVLTVPVLPRPDEFTGKVWLPARKLELAQQISAADALRVGEPVTRTILVDAVGLEENMLVELEWPELPGARIYPDQPQGITRDNGRWVLGHKEFRYAVVPEQEGELVLPALELPWWDTVNGVQRTARVPAHTLYVQPARLPVEPAAPPNPDAITISESGSDGSPAVANGYWRVLTFVFGSLWLATLVFAWWRRPVRTGPRAGRVPSAGNGKEAAVLKAMARASHGNDRQAARRYLQDWLQEWGPTGGRSLLEFAAELENNELRESVCDLDSEGFRAGSGTWDGKAFWRRFRAWRKGRDAGRAAVPDDPTDLYAKANRRFWKRIIRGSSLRGFRCRCLPDVGASRRRVRRLRPVRHARGARSSR